MADDTAVATPDAPQTRTFQIPVEGAPQEHAHQGRRFKIPIEGKSFQIPVEAAPAPETPKSEEPKTPVHEPVWWQLTKERKERLAEALPHPSLEGVKKGLSELPSEISNVFFAGGVPGTTTPEVQKPVQQAVEEQAQKGMPAAKTAVELQAFTDQPRVNVTGTKAFQSVFDPQSKKWYSRGTTGFVKALENQTSLGNLFSLATIYAAPESVGAGTGISFQAQLATSGVEGVTHAVAAGKDKDEGAASQAWGDLFGNAAVIVGMHYGHKGVETFKERDNTKILNDSAQDLYGQKFEKLTDTQKTDVLYKSLENSDPKFKKRVDAEVASLNAKRGVSKGRAAMNKAIAGGVEVTPPDPAEIEQQRVQAAKNLVRQMLVAKARREAYQKQAQAREIQARRAQAAQIVSEAQARESSRAQGDIDRAAAGKKSAEEQRGFPVKESRTAENLPVTGLRKTTEREPGQRYEPEPAAPAIPVTERRTAPEIVEAGQRSLAAEVKANELTEGRMGQSFSTLPLARQRVAARWMERFHPEAWAAFQATPAHTVFQDHVEMAGMADAALKHYVNRNGAGESQTLSPGADIHAGTARLVLERTNVNEALQADPATHRDLNEHAEQSMGRSFDALSPDDRVPALAEYFRDKPEKLQAFLTPDLSERIRSGQHIDLANMEAELIDRQQIHLLMEGRDQIQRDMEREAADKLVDQERERHNKELSDAVYASLTGKDSSLEPVHAASRGLTKEAGELGLGPISTFDDVFRIEKVVRDTRPDLRTGKMNQFLTRMNQVRAAAEDHILKSLADATADAFRSGDEEAIQKAARQAMEFAGQAADLQDAADRARQEGSERAADAAERAANVAKAKADAVQVGAETAREPAPAPQPRRPPAKISIGRETRIKTPRNPEGYPAHYAIGELTDLQTSHMPHTFEKRPGYNQKGQPRDYSADKDAQTAAHGRAANLDVDVLLSNGVTTMEGPAVVDQDMDVISANGRTLSQLIALKDHPAEWAKYVQGLHERAAQFNIDPAEVFKYTNPVLMKVLDTPVDKNSSEWALMGLDMNDSPSRGISETDAGVAMTNLMSPESVDRLTKIVESLPLLDKDSKALTAREAMRARSAEIAKLLTDAGVISPNRMVEYVDPETGDLKEKAKDLFENMLAGFTVSDPAVLGRSAASVRDKLTRAGMFFVQMRNAGENWNLQSMNTDAVRLLTRAQDAAARLSHLVPREAGAEKSEGSLVERFLHPERFVDSKGFGPTGSLSFDGQSLHPPVHAGVEALAMALEESPREYASMMAKFADRAEAKQATMWGAENPADAFTNEIAAKYDLKVVPEEWGAVTGLSDQVKAELEKGRGPLPVEPEVHAETAVSNVTPDSSSVTDVIPEGPKSVRELNKAMERHPNLSQEEIDAANQILTEIMPRAIGESLENLLGNRRLVATFGGKAEGNRGYHQMIDEASAIVNVSDTGDISTWLHEVTHFIRRFLNPVDQEVANKFVGAKPGEEWTPEQEEMFTKAHERYIYDGGIRRGKLEKVFGTISRAMQKIYTEAQARGLIKGTPELNQMFDRWYDWSRAERKPITARVDVDALEEAAKGKVEIPENAKVIARTLNSKPTANATTHVFLDEDTAREAVKELADKKVLGSWELLRVKGESTVYLRADARKGKKLFQPSLNETIELARKARDLEAQLKRTTDPREQARLRGALNGIEDKMKGATGIIGGKAEPRDESVIQLVNGMSEMPSLAEPTTPAQAVKAQQVFGDPTAIALGGERGPKRAATPETSGKGPGGAERVPEPAGSEHGESKGAKIAKPESDPLAKVKAAKLKAPEQARGTPVVDPGTWREHVEALGLPVGTPPPTVRLEPSIRNLMKYPGQAEAIEGALSALQQFDGTVLASAAGTGKTWMLSAIAEHLLGTSGDKVGLLVTRSQNLIHEADGFVDTARKLGVDVQSLPGKMSDLETGMYAATYSGIRGNRDILTIPWDFVLFDESGEAANWTESEQGKAVVLLGHAAKKVVYSSATTHSTVMELGYMHKLGLWPKGGFFEWAQQFGLREVGPNTYAGGSAAKKLEKLREQIIERGQWQQLYKDMGGTEAHAVLVPQTPEVREGVRNIRAAFEMAKAAFIRAGMSKYITPTAGHESIYLKRFISGARLKDAIALGRKAVEQGWTPVFFTEYRSPAETGMEFFHNLPGDLGTRVNKMLPPLPDVVGEMRKAFGPKVGIFAGEANEARATELEGLHSGEKDALYMTYAAGGVGANAQDKVGDKPRLGIFIDMPWGGKMLEQGTNRTWRYGSQSGVVNVFMTSDALPEMKLLATKILPRMRSLKAAVFGEKVESSLSRKLREAAGIPEELLQYDHGEESEPQAAEFEKDGEGASYTSIADYELPKADKFKNKPMKYKGEGRKLFQSSVERRQNAALRKRIDEMTPEEMRVALMTSDKTGLPNGRAFDEIERDHHAPAVAMSDADGLKAFNDKFGYEAGTNLLRAKAAALKEAGLEAYHDKGDEFLYRGESVQDLRAKLEKAREILRNVAFDVKADGKEITLKGVDFSYGTGTDLHEAEERQHEHKAEREAQGLRKRGELGGITEVQRGREHPRAERHEVKLYQGPKDEDPFQKAANDAWEQLLGRTAKLPAAEARMVTANEHVVKLAASEAAQRAMGSGVPVEEVARRKITDLLNNEELENKALIEFYRKKKYARAISKFVQDTAWISLQSGDKTVEKVFKRAGLAKDGEEMKRRIIDFDLRKGLYQGRMQAIVRDIVHGNHLKPTDIELMSKVVEGMSSTNDPRILKAVKEWRQFTSDIRKGLAEAGSAVVIYDVDGKRKEIPYSMIEDDPNYWPRMYDWNKEFVMKDPKTGEKEVKTLAEIMNMPTSNDRREKVIDQFAKERNIPVIQARAFFERANRGLRLAGNVERAREWNIPTYGRDRAVIERYIDEVSSTMAATEVHGQFRQKTDPIISKLNKDDADLVNHIITSDLDPAHLPDTSRAALSTGSAFIITGKMFYSPLKVSTHLWKVWMGTNTRSFAAGIMRGVMHPVELMERARDCNALLEYSKSIWMREYGMKRRGIAQKFLDFNGFTIQVEFSRVMSSAVGRHFFESYVYPKLLKDPKNEFLRWKLKDQYGMSDGQIDDIVKNGYGPDDVRRMELAAANWTTGSNRASEMPPAFRSEHGAAEWKQNLTTLLRTTQMLHGFMFKTANFVNRAVFEQLSHANWKSAEPFHTVTKFAVSAGLAGYALEELLHLRHYLQGSTEAEIEKHRHEWLRNHPLSAEALWWSMANMSMAIGIQPLVELFNEMATRNPKDRQKLATQRRFTKDTMAMPLGIPGQDVEAIMTAFEDMINSFADTGKHHLSRLERQKNILKRLLHEEIVGTDLIPDTAPTKVQPRPFPRASHHRASSVLQ